MRPARGSGGASRPNVARWPALSGPQLPMLTNATADLILPVARWPRLTLSFASYAVYIFVIHSYKLAIGQEALLVALVGLLLERVPLRLPPGFWWCAAFFVWAGITVLVTDFPAEARQAWTDYAKVLIIFFVATNAARTPVQVSAILVFWLACFAVWPVRGTLFNFVYGIGNFGRYAWNFLFSNPNDLASIVLLMLGLTLVAARSRHSRSLRIVAVVGTAILTLIVFLTQSRGGFLGLAVFALIAVTTHRRPVRVMLALGTLAALVITLAPSSVWDRLGGLKSVTSTSTLREVDPEHSAESRYLIWQVALAIARDHPVTGVGFGAYEYTHREYVERNSEWRDQRGVAIRGRKDTHNTYLNALAETGILGLVLLLGFIVFFALFLVRTASRLAKVSARQSEQFKYLLAAWVGYWVTATFATVHRVIIVYLFAGFAASLATQYAVFGQAKPVTGPDAADVPTIARGRRRTGAA